MHKGFPCFEKRMQVHHPYFEVLNLRRPHEAVMGDTIFFIFIWLCQVLVAKHGIFRCGM